MARTTTIRPRCGRRSTTCCNDGALTISRAARTRAQTAWPLALAATNAERLPRMGGGSSGIFSTLPQPERELPNSAEGPAAAWRRRYGRGRWCLRARRTSRARPALDQPSNNQEPAGATWPGWLPTTLRTAPPCRCGRRHLTGSHFARRRAGRWPPARPQTAWQAARLAPDGRTGVARNKVGLAGAAPRDHRGPPGVRIQISG